MTSAAAAADKIYGRQDWSNITRPRRVEPDIAAYVAEVDGLLENPEEGIDEALLLNNIFGELAKKEASVMSDKTCSHVMEKLIRRATCRQARGILSGCAGYFAFLATNRYSSHVLQTLLHLIWPLMEQDEEGGEEGSAEGGEGGEGQGGEGGGEDGADGGDGPPPPSLKQLVLNICDELADTLGWSRAMTDISATHVLRSLLCVLAGREAVQDRRGKKAKHRQLDAHAFAESAGGMGATPVELVLAFEALGRHAVPGPWAESVAYLPLAVGDDEVLSALAEGAVGSVAVPPHVPYAVDGAVADHLYVVADGRLTTGTAGAAHRSVDRSRRLAEVISTGPTSGDSTSGRGDLGAAFELGALATSAQLLGAGERILADSVTYVKQRRQFGREIGSYQAIKHALADVKIAPSPRSSRNSPTRSGRC